MMISFKLFLALLSASTCCLVTSFSPMPLQQKQRSTAVVHGGFPSPSFLTSSFSSFSITTLQASVVYPSDDGRIRFSDDATTLSSPPSSISFSTSSVIEFLQTEALDRLARLAVAFSPLERAIQLKDIEQISIISINDRSIDIQAMLCEDEGCVSLSIPINFPRLCTASEDYELCVVDNIGTLDVRANELLLQTRLESKLEEEGFNLGYKKQWLLEDHDLSYPDWWIPPTVADDCYEESKAIVQLLNDDEFARDVRSLVHLGLLEQQQQQQQILQEDPELLPIVELAAVTAVGPAGVILRAFLRNPGEENDRLRKTELPMKFPSTATSVQSLRSAVLSLMATVES